MRTILTAARLWDGNTLIERPMVTIEDGIVESIASGESTESPNSAKILNFPGATLGPAFFDVHIHGAAGHDVMEATPEALDTMTAFLASRGIDLPEGSPDDPPDALTISGLGERKNEIVLELIHEHGVEPYDGSVRYVNAARDAGLRCYVVSSSTNCRDVLAAAGITALFEEIIDGHVAEAEHLRGKPAPDTYLAGARAAAETPEHAAVFEDALVGVEAGRAGKFAIVVGIDRVGQAAALKAHGADVVVGDLSELLETP